MNPRDLVLAALNGEDLYVRQWVKSAARAGVDYSRLPAPEGLGPDELAVAGGMVELLAQRSGQGVDLILTSDSAGIWSPLPASA